MVPPVLWFCLVVALSAVWLSCMKSGNDFLLPNGFISCQVIASTCTFSCISPCPYCISLLTNSKFHASLLSCKTLKLHVSYDNFHISYHMWQLERHPFHTDHMLCYAACCYAEFIWSVCLVLGTFNSQVIGSWGRKVEMTRKPLLYLYSLVSYKNKENVYVIYVKAKGFICCHSLCGHHELK